MYKHGLMCKGTRGGWRFMTGMHHRELTEVAVGLVCAAVSSSKICPVSIFVSSFLGQETQTGGSFSGGTLSLCHNLCQCGPSGVRLEQGRVLSHSYSLASLDSGLQTQTGLTQPD